MVEVFEVRFDPKRTTILDLENLCYLKALSIFPTDLKDFTLVYVVPGEGHAVGAASNSEEITEEMIKKIKEDFIRKYHYGGI